jgi:Ser-tRNA(Ala) deacylase AlaX
MATELIYLRDFDVVGCTAKIIEVRPAEDQRVAVVLDKTCFYPRGGGQDWDTGIISTEGAKFKVEEVRLDENSTVRHIGKFDSGVLEAGVKVDCAVDTERRMINTRLHSAGHVVDLAVARLGLDWKPIRGAHYPHMSFVEYDGEITPAEYEGIRGQLQAVVDEVIANAPENEIRFMPVDEMHTICRHVPENIPANKPARVVIYARWPTANRAPRL